VTNGANEILPANTGQYDGDQVQTWTGHSWAAVYLDSTQPYGFADALGNAAKAPILASGQGYLYYNASGVSNNLTYVGEVRTGTNIVNITSPPEVWALGSPLPLAGGVISTLQFANTGSYDGDSIQIAVTAGGNVKGFRTSYFDSTQTTGFSDSLGNQAPEPQIGIGQGFFFDNANATPVTWKQVLNP